MLRARARTGESREMSTFQQSIVAKMHKVRRKAGDIPCWWRAEGLTHREFVDEAGPFLIRLVCSVCGMKLFGAL